MECWPVNPTIRATVQHLRAGMWRAIGNNRIRHLPRSVALRTRPAVRTMVEQACRTSMLPSIVALATAGGLLMAHVTPNYMNRDLPDPGIGPGAYGAKSSIPVGVTNPQEMLGWSTGRPKSTLFAEATLLQWLETIPPAQIFSGQDPMEPTVLGTRTAADSVILAEPVPLAPLAPAFATMLWAQRRWPGRHQKKTSE